MSIIFAIPSSNTFCSPDSYSIVNINILILLIWYDKNIRSYKLLKLKFLCKNRQLTQYLILAIGQNLAT